MSDDRRALEEALIAIDGCVNTLVMARLIVLRALNDAPEADNPPAPEQCPHEALENSGGGIYTCVKCGEGFQ